MLENVLISTVKGMEGRVIQPFLETLSLGSAEIYEATSWGFVFCVRVCTCLTSVGDLCRRKDIF